MSMSHQNVWEIVMGIVLVDLLVVLMELLLDHQLLVLCWEYLLKYVLVRLMLVVELD